MRMLVTGSTGLVGSAVVDCLRGEGHEVVRLVRAPRGGEAEVVWHPEEGHIDEAGLAGMDAVVHLAGENIFGWWSDDKKRKIRESRVQGTRILSESLARMDPPPRVLVSASAVGIYGNRGDEILDESSMPGTTFLAGVCQEWEEACGPAREAGIRVVNPRIAMVLTSEGGPLKLMLPAFKAGLGGPIGDGRQYMSWIAIEDLVGCLLHVLEHETLSGPVNAAAPQPVTNQEFTETLGRVLGRPAVLRLPKLVATTLMRQMAEELLLSSERVVPTRLEASGYKFRYPQLEQALRAQLAKQT